MNAELVVLKMTLQTRRGRKCRLMKSISALRWLAEMMMEMKERRKQVKATTDDKSDEPDNKDITEMSINDKLTIYLDIPCQDPGHDQNHL